MSFSHDFAEKIRSGYSDKKKVMEALEDGDRPRMAVALQELMPSPDFVLKCLNSDELETLREACEAAKPIANLLKRLMEYEMAHGFAIVRRREFDAHDVPL